MAIGISLKATDDDLIGSAYAINPDTRDVQPFGEPPNGLVLDFNAIIDGKPR